MYFAPRLEAIFLFSAIIAIVGLRLTQPQRKPTFRSSNKRTQTALRQIAG
jgi:hypothetical protein